MARDYQLSKQITKEEREAIQAEISKLPKVKMVGFVHDNEYLEIDTTEEVARKEVMDVAVNVCKRIGRGCQLSFAGFAV